MTRINIDLDIDFFRWCYQGPWQTKSSPCQENVCSKCSVWGKTTQQRQQDEHVWSFFEKLFCLVRSFCIISAERPWWAQHWRRCAVCAEKALLTAFSVITIEPVGKESDKSLLYSRKLFLSKWLTIAIIVSAAYQPHIACIRMYIDIPILHLQPFLPYANHVECLLMLF